MRRQVTAILMLSVVFLAFWPRTSYAYIDPGTGSMIIQGLIGLAAAAAVTLRLYWRRIWAFFGKGSGEDPGKE